MSKILKYVTFSFDDGITQLYLGHEVAVHTLTHPNLTNEKEETIVYQVEEDRKRLSQMVGYDVCGMAYPCGGVNNDERVAKIIKDHTGVKYISVNTLKRCMHETYVR